MAKEYSDWDGQPASINRMCRQFSFPRPWFNEYKHIHGWTHDREPFSAEDVMTRPIEDLTDSALQQRRQALYESFEVAKWQETKQDADKWRAFDQTVLRPLSETIERFAPSYRPPLLSIPAHLVVGQERYALMIAPMDLHFGKNGWSDAGGQVYSKLQAEQLLKTHTEDVIAQSARFGRPEVIYFPVGSDWFHVDNLRSSTTADTPQDLDGLPENMMFEGCMLAVKHIDLLRQFGPVVLIFCPGNHDYQNSLSLLHFLFAWFRNEADVTVHLATQPRQYEVYGNTLLGTAHGNDEKVAQLPGLMASEAKEAWAITDFRYFFTGHLHHDYVRELDGITHYQVPSLSSADRWHDKKGHVLSHRALHAHKISYDRGINGIFISSVLEQSPARRLTFGFKLANHSR